MNTNASASQTRFSTPCVLLAFTVWSAEVFLACSAFAATPPTAASNVLPAAAGASLSFEERVACQRAIEEVYWRHRTSADNKSARPPLAQVLPEAALREKVTDALRMSDALSTIWKQPITGEQLQAEIDRMAAGSKQPGMLREIWAALRNDPHLIAECLARPQVADRLMRDHYSNDPRFNAAARAIAHDERAQYGTVGEMRQMSGSYNVADFTRSASPETATGTQLSAAQFDALIQEVAGTFVMREDGPSFTRPPITGARPVDEIPVGRVSDVREGTDRFSVVAVLSRDQDHIELASVEWPKVSFDAWWKSARDTLSTQVEEPQRAYQVRAVSSDGDSSGPTVSSGTDEWRPIAGMDFRVLALHVWTGSEMIVWGGWSNTDFAFVNPHRDGGRYDPATDTWRPISVIGAPLHRMLGLMPQAVWTGKEMIIWGGFDPASGDNYNNGARYNPATDTWTPMSTVGAPVPRDSYSIVWTGTEMIVWGGWNGHDEYMPWFLNSGGRYNPETDTWQPTSTGLGCPAARQHHVAVWTGTRMIVWGGIGWILSGQPTSGTDDFNSGGVYDPQTDTWTSLGTSLAGAPTDRYYPTAVWTGTEMIIWGGRGATGATGSGGYDSVGGRYNPATDTWTPTSTVNVPGLRKWHFAVWTGTEMLVYGGDGPGPNNQNGGRYNPATDTWVTINQNGQPPLSYWLNGVWTGSEMLVWGGTGRDDGRYNPNTDTWAPMNTPAISQPNDGPYGHSVVWTGSEMIIWGGRSLSGMQNIGGVYVPSTDTWRLTTTVSAPDPRYSHTAVWSGDEMIVWGGIGSANTGNTGARYNPATDAWTVTSLTASTPSKRGGHTAVVTGGEMIVWGGRNGATAYDSGARYDLASDTWQPTNSTGAPSARYSHSAVWTGSRMIVWGGGTTTGTDTGAQYDPATDAWQPTTASGAPSARSSHTAIWTGSEMIVWGGGSYSGARYDPMADAWQPMSSIGYSGGVIGDTAVWTGSEMIVWGGGNTNGGRYDPAADMWQPTSIPRFLLGRSDHSAVWTGSSMIVFGGYSMTTTGGMYLPAPIAPIPTSVVSRKTHGAAGNFDIDLPLIGTPGIECRTGGTSGDHQMIITFAVPVTFTGAAMTAGTGTVSTTTGSGTTAVTVNLTGVTNAQTITLTLSGVNDGTSAGDVGVRMGVLLGDTTANGTVNSSDIGQAKANSGQTTDGTNFRTDVTVNGAVNSSDIGTIKAQSGTTLQ